MSVHLTRPRQRERQQTEQTIAAAFLGLDLQHLLAARRAGDAVPHQEEMMALCAKAGRRSPELALAAERSAALAAARRRDRVPTQAAREQHDRHENNDERREAVEGRLQQME